MSAVSCVVVKIWNESHIIIKTKAKFKNPIQLRDTLFVSCASSRFDSRGNVIVGTWYNIAAGLIFIPSSLMARTAERSVFASCSLVFRLYVRGMSLKIKQNVLPNQYSRFATVPFYSTLHYSMLSVTDTAPKRTQIGENQADIRVQRPRITY